MATGKRAASDDSGNSQMVVKRPNVGSNSKAVAVVNGSAANGALIQTVSLRDCHGDYLAEVLKESLLIVIA